MVAAHCTDSSLAHSSTSFNTFQNKAGHRDTTLLLDTDKLLDDKTSSHTETIGHEGLLLSLSELLQLYDTKTGIFFIQDQGLSEMGRRLITWLTNIFSLSHKILLSEKKKMQSHL